MGGTSWSDDLYEDRKAYQQSTGTSAFSHDDDIRRGRTTAAAHDILSPKGITVRESRDSDAHPNSVAIAIFFDVTGSMGRAPRTFKTKMCGLMNTLLEKNYCVDPQILVGAVGDWHSDRVPLQIGQFESGNEIDEQLGLVYLEGNGGGQRHESYQNALYFLANKTSMDCWEKRGKKGYAFILGDELPYGGSTPKEIESIFGDKIGETVNTPDLIRQVQEKFHLFYLIPGGTSYCNDPSLRAAWESLIGKENVIDLNDPDLVCETIGGTVGMFENAITLDQVTTDLGNGDSALMVRNALTSLAASSAVQAAANGGMPASGKSTTVRL